jgi:hypothetical protein
LHDDRSINLNVSVSVSSSSSSSSVLSIPNPHHPLSSTTDAWTGDDHESYVCITVHWLDDRWTMRSALLDITLATERHTGEQISEWMVEAYHNNYISVCLFFDS